MAEKRIAVLVSGGGTNLQALIDAQKRGELGGGRIVAVISSKAGAYALERAKNAGIDGYILPRKDFSSNQAMTVGYSVDDEYIIHYWQYPYKKITETN